MVKNILSEKYGSSKVQKTLYSEGDKLVVKRSTGSQGKFTSRIFFMEILREIFLPQGYPHSVSKDYMEYQIWDTIQALASSMSGTLANQAVLKGVGVGDSSATVLAATFTWMLKDGVGMIGRIVFAWYKGTFLDCDCKRWRLFADILNDLAMLIELVSPHYPLIFTPLVCLSGLGKSIVGVAGGATRAALTMHQARRNNMADVSAKDGSQETLSNLIGLLLNMWFVFWVSGNITLIWVSFVILTLIHLYANYRAVKAVRMETLNQARFHILASHWLLSGEAKSVDECNSEESVVFPLKRRFANVLMGVSLSHISNKISRNHLEEIIKLYDHTNYILYFDRKQARFGSKRDVFIFLRHSANELDQIQALFHAELIDLLTYSPGNVSNFLNNREFQKIETTFSMDETDPDFYYKSLSSVKNLLPQFLEDMKLKGWKLSPVLFGPDEWRIS